MMQRYGKRLKVPNNWTRIWAQFNSAAVLPWITTLQLSCISCFSYISCTSTSMECSFDFISGLDTESIRAGYSKYQGWILWVSKQDVIFDTFVKFSIMPSLVQEMQEKQEIQGLQRTGRWSSGRSFFMPTFFGIMPFGNALSAVLKPLKSRTLAVPVRKVE